MKTWLILILLLLSSCSHYRPSWRVPAAVEVRAHPEAAKTISDVHDASVPEKVMGLANARVVVADYDLLRRDFKELRQLSHAEIDQWLLKNTAYMSLPQTKQEGANTEIYLNHEERTAYRPPQYGRALVFQADSPLEEDNKKLSFIRKFLEEDVLLKADINVSDLSNEFAHELKDKFDLEEQKIVTEMIDNLSHRPSLEDAGYDDWLSRIRKTQRSLIKMEIKPENHIGLIDAKGVGSLAPTAGGHSDGLATLGESIREYVYEKLVNTIFMHEDETLKTVGTYAVIDTGFGVKHQDGSTSPGGIILRQAHNRFESQASLLSESSSLRVENILRKYGVTTAGAYRDKYPYDKINVQGTKDGAILDFGGFLVVDHFGREGRHFYGSQTLIDPVRDRLVQPDPNLRVPLEVWGTTVSGVEDPKLDNIWLWSHELANAFRDGRAGRDDVLTHVRNLLGPVNAKLGASKKNCHELFESLVRFD